MPRTTGAILFAVLIIFAENFALNDKKKVNYVTIKVFVGQPRLNRVCQSQLTTNIVMLVNKNATFRLKYKIKSIQVNFYRHMA